ncbi:3-deoxy-D-manno-octulosonic acid transferase, partial [Pseudomonadota bacterium]
VQEIAKVTRREWGVDRKVWVAGSTRPGEEELLLTVFNRLKQKLPELLLVLAPRHPERFNSVTKLCEKSGFKTLRRSASPGEVASNVDIYIGDTMGELQLFYAAADVVYVGGSLVPNGGHNILEACAVGVPVIFGPHMFNFVDISQLTIERRAGTQVSNVNELELTVARYFADPELRFSAGENGKKLVEENRGALERTVAMLSPCLNKVVSAG